MVSEMRLSFATLIFSASLPFTMSATAGDFGGNVGKLAATYELEWKPDGSVAGIYFYPSLKSGTVYRMNGRMIFEDLLYIEEYTGTELSARCFLRKSLDQPATYTGRMLNTDGRKFDMTIVEKSPDSDKWIEETVSAGENPLAFRDAGQFYVFQSQLCNILGCTAERTTVSSITLGDAADDIVFQSKESSSRTFRMPWTRAMGPVPFVEGLDALVYVTSGGEVVTASVWLVPDKWRKTPEGLVEFLVFGEAKEGDMILGKSPYDGSALRGMKKPFVIRPVRFAEFTVSDYFIALKGNGVFVATFEAGAGMVELESIDLDPGEPGEVPWVDLKSGFPAIPSNQELVYNH